MKTITLTVTLALVSCFLASDVSAQEKKERRLSAAFRYGPASTGASVNVFLKKTSSLGLMYSSERSDRRNIFSVIYSERYRFWNVKGMKWFGGAGLHMGWRNITNDDEPSIRISRSGSDVPRERLFVLGTAALLGLEYSVPNTPVWISLDTRPYVDLINGQSSIRDFALSIGFCF